MENNKDIHALETIEEIINYNNYTFKKISNYLTPGLGLDFGCGFGGFLKFINKYQIYNFTGYEINDTAISNLESRSLPIITSLEDISNTYDNVVSINVLEHVDNDILELEEIHKVLKNKGKLILYLPNSEKLWTDMDDLVGHVRRYSKIDLIKKLENTGYEITHIEYVDFIGSLVIKITKLFRVNISFNKKLIIFYDKFVFKFFKYLDFIFKNRYGKNILIVANAKK